MNIRISAHRLLASLTLVVLIAVPFVAFAQADTGSTVSCPNISHPLSRGMSGTDILTLQTYLVAQGLLSHDAPTGYFGPQTQIAIQQWQATHGIVSSGTPETTGFGMVGASTRRALAACTGSAANPPAFQQIATNATLNFATPAHSGNESASLLNASNESPSLKSIAVNQLDTHSSTSIAPAYFARTTNHGGGYNGCTPGPNCLVGRTMDIINSVYGDPGNYEFAVNIQAIQNSKILTNPNDISALNATGVRGAAAAGSANDIWGGNVLFKDQTGRKSSASGSGYSRGLEVNGFASGPDDINKRIGMDIIMGEEKPSTDGPTSHYAGIQITPASAYAGGNPVTIKNAIVIDRFLHTGIGDIQFGVVSNASQANFVSDGKAPSIAAFYAHHPAGSDWTAFLSPGFNVLGNGMVHLTAANAGMEIGSTNAVNTPYLDFHSSGSANDFDARILASNGSSSSGQGGLTYNASGGHNFIGNVSVTGKITTDQICVRKSDGTSVCITGDQLAAILSATSQGK